MAIRGERRCSMLVISGRRGSYRGWPYREREDSYIGREKMLDVSNVRQAGSRREWPYRERENGYTGRERILDIGNIGQTGELLGLAI